MTEAISAWAGSYTRPLYISLVTEMEIILVAMLFSSPLKKRRLFVLRLLCWLLSVVGIVIASCFLRAAGEHILCRIGTNLLLYVSVLLLHLLCHDETLTTIIRTWCAEIAAMQIGASLYNLLMRLFGADSGERLTFIQTSYGLELLIYFALHFAFYALIFRLTGRQRVKDPAPSISKRIVILTLFALLVMTVLDGIAGRYRQESKALYLVERAFVFFTASFILILRDSLVLYGQAQEEISAMDQVMAQQRRQYESIRENINLVNIRCHDLKHQLDKLAGKLTDEEVASLRQAMNIYDSTIKTGNEVLDVVLYEHQLVCEQEHIQLSCMADGEALSFMRTRHIYSLFSNAMRNAIEAVRKVNDPERRIISINVENIDRQVEITVTNYCEDTPRMVDGLPQTTKGDTGHHGFGTMSMRYIVEQYDGSLQVLVHNGIFTLNITIPLPARS